MKAWELAFKLLLHPFSSVIIEVESEWDDEFHFRYINNSGGKRIVLSDYPADMVNEKIKEAKLCL